MRKLKIVAAGVLAGAAALCARPALARDACRHRGDVGAPYCGDDGDLLADAQLKTIYGGQDWLH